MSRYQNILEVKMDIFNPVLLKCLSFWKSGKLKIVKHHVILAVIWQRCLWIIDWLGSCYWFWIQSKSLLLTLRSSVFPGWM